MSLVPPTVCRRLIRRRFSIVLSCLAVAEGAVAAAADAVATFRLALISCFSFLVSELLFCLQQIFFK
jgi:hypothetical protein